MIVQEERGPMMVATLEMMKGMLDNNNEVDNHRHLLVKIISHIILKMKTTTLEESVQVLEPLESHIEEDNEGWCHTTRTHCRPVLSRWVYRLNSVIHQTKPTFMPLMQWVMVSFLKFFQVPLMKSMKGITILLPHKCHTSFHISYNNKDFKRAYGKTLDFPSMDRLSIGLKKFMHGMFVHTINTIETPCPGMNIVFNKMGSLHLTIWWNHIDLHFGIKDHCNVICIMFMCKLFSFNKIKYFLTHF